MDTSLANRPDLEVLLPVHNEAESIEKTIREIDEAIAPLAKARFILCEDGSSDGTQQVLMQLADTLPLKLIMSEQRKGYSQAVIDGMKALEADYLLCLDSDGQCDPKDFAKFWAARAQQDVAIGWRVNRADTALRKTLSGAFYWIYRTMFRVPVHDPSCPFVLARKHVIQSVLPGLGEMREGFWWEFVLRVYRRGFSLREIPVNHRRRAAGQTRVYRLGRMPDIGYRHIRALFRIWRQPAGS